jgi:phosphotransferase system HPr (HPr) family protein
MVTGDCVLTIPHDSESDSATATGRYRFTEFQDLHLRTAMQIVKTMRQFPCCLHVRCGARQADGNSILELLLLMAVAGSELILEARGPRSSEAVARIYEILSHTSACNEENDL